ncbi:hypothetical protein M9H77_19095 [Catharanthus roseus]|uniref:Uncharacterized protein n=1 Tax=Catharanthus roseus TaxID=4058 RepID=A0ACC0B9B3_CATRO|nr:hypothetical protein M9H77_19095 [Catharanthus roseus]
MLLHTRSFPFICSTYFSVSSGTCPYPFAAYDNCDYFCATYRAVKHDKWPIAMQHEIDALELNATWTLTILPLERKSSATSGCIKLNLSGLTSDTPKMCTI